MSKRLGLLLIVGLTLFACTSGGEVISPEEEPLLAAGEEVGEDVAEEEPVEEVVEPTEVPPTEMPSPEPIGPLQISSPAFENGGDIPAKYSCLGENLSPELEWSGVPADAQSLLLFFYDPDAGFESGASVEPGFVHWVVYNIPGTSTGYAEDMSAGATLQDGALQGSNDFAQFSSPGETFPGGSSIKLVGYDGPCPGSKHLYVFTLYALDVMLDLPAEALMADILAAMDGHIIEEAEWSGFFDPSS